MVIDKVFSAVGGVENRKLKRHEKDVSGGERYEKPRAERGIKHSDVQRDCDYYCENVRSENAEARFAVKLKVERFVDFFAVHDARADGYRERKEERHRKHDNPDADHERKDKQKTRCVHDEKNSRGNGDCQNDCFFFRLSKFENRASRYRSDYSAQERQAGNRGHVTVQNVRNDVIANAEKIRTHKQNSQSLKKRRKALAFYDNVKRTFADGDNCEKGKHRYDKPIQHGFKRQIYIINE